MEKSLNKKLDDIAGSLFQIHCLAYMLVSLSAGNNYLKINNVSSYDFITPEIIMEKAEFCIEEIERMQRGGESKSIPAPGN